MSSAPLLAWSAEIAALSPTGEPVPPEIAPLALIVVLPPVPTDWLLARMPNVPPDTSFAVMVMSVPLTWLTVMPVLLVVALTGRRVPATAPVAVTLTAPEPLLLALIPCTKPVTSVAEIVMPVPPLLTVKMPAPLAPLTAPVVVIAIAPLPSLVALRPLPAPLTAPPPASWVKVSDDPVVDRMKADWLPLAAVKV